MGQIILFLTIGCLIGYFLGTLHRNWNKKTLLVHQRLGKFYRALPEILQSSLDTQKDGLPYDQLAGSLGETLSFTSVGLYLFTDYTEQTLTLRGAWNTPETPTSFSPTLSKSNIDHSFGKQLVELNSKVERILIRLLHRGRSWGVILGGMPNARMSRISRDISVIREMGISIGKSLSLIEDISFIVDQKNEKLREEFCQELQLRLNRCKIPTRIDVAIDSFIKPKPGINSDYLDYIPLGKNQFLVVHGEVTGKGFNAILTLTTLKSLLHSLSPILKKPSTILDRINRIFTKYLEGDFFASVTLLKVDLETHQIEISKAGNGGMLRVSTNVDSRIDQIRGDAPLGVHREQGFQELSYAVQKGDVWVLFSDGVTETQDTEGNFFTMDHLVEILKANQFLKSRDILEKVKQDLFSFKEGKPLADDLSILVMKFR